jgi:hypothetical protein
MSKIKAILFLIKCMFYVSMRIIKGQVWNRITVDLEEKDGSRTQINYAKRMTGYDLQTYNREIK